MSLEVYHSQVSVPYPCCDLTVPLCRYPLHTSHPGSEVLELLAGLSVLARYYFPVAIGAQAPETFAGTVTFIGLVRSGAALIVFTAPLLLVAWVVLPLVLAVFGVPREGRERAAAQLQQLRQWVRAGPAIWPDMRLW